jgi:hypothetical protein
MMFSGCYLVNLKNVIHIQGRVSVKVGSLKRTEIELSPNKRGPNGVLPVKWLGLGIYTCLLLDIIQFL